MKIMVNGSSLLKMRHFGLSLLLAMGALGFTKASAGVNEETVLRGPATISRGVQALATPSRLLYNGETLISADLIVNYRQVQAEQARMSMGDFIPLNLLPSDNSNYVMSAIADRSIATIMNRPEIRESTFGRAATRVEKKLKTEVVMGSKAPHSIEHKLNFQVLAFQSQAEIRYEGITNAAVSYQARNDIVHFEVSEQLPKVTKVVLTHELHRDQRVSNLNLRWDF